VGPDLRQIRYFVAVADNRSFTKAAAEAHVAQQAISQQVKALEGSLGVTLLRRNSRRVELTAAGAVFVGECKRLLSIADRATQRARAAARGEAGTLRIAFTLATAHEMVPLLLDSLGERYPDLKVDVREVFASDVGELLVTERFDVALAPETAYPNHLKQVTIRREPMFVAVGQRSAHARRKSIPLSSLRGDRLELWPRDMAPGYHDTVIAAARSAGFEPEVDDKAGGSTVWGNIARDRGVGLVNASLVDQLPRGVKLIKVQAPQPLLAISAVWRREADVPAIDRLLDTARSLGAEHHWL
jgi:DNA-binding transcriptional LysR family regulator